jgi:hypothetical protein
MVYIGGRIKSYWANIVPNRNRKLIKFEQLLDSKIGQKALKVTNWEHITDN